MIVICLEGSHGSGKTSLLSSLEMAGFNVLDEAFIDMPSYTKTLHPQSLCMESMWVCNWFERLLKKKQEIDEQSVGDTIFFADRSPYSAVFYSRGDKGRLLAPVIREQIRELRESANIEVITIYVQVARDVLWGRIQERLRREPSREQFSENKKEWMDKTLQFYDSFPWDCTVDNSVQSVEDVMENLVSNVSRRSPTFQRIVSSNAEQLRESSESPTEFSARVRAASITCRNDVVEQTLDADISLNRSFLEAGCESTDTPPKSQASPLTTTVHTVCVTSPKPVRPAPVSVNEDHLTTPDSSGAKTTKSVSKLGRPIISPDTIMARSQDFGVRTAETSDCN